MGDISEEPVKPSTGRAVRSVTNTGGFVQEDEPRECGPLGRVQADRRSASAEFRWSLQTLAKRPVISLTDPSGPTVGRGKGHQGRWWIWSQAEVKG
jgi:hypothetical protein